MPDIAAHDPSPSEFFEKRISTQGLLVIERHVPVGFVHFRGVDGCAYIEEMNVDPDHAGQRLGALLLDGVAELARARSLDALLLSTFRNVPWNAPYYRKLGFIDIPDDRLTSSLLAIRNEHIERGLDETQRVFMRRAV